MKPTKLSRSTRAQKKYQIEVDGRTIHFGAAGYEDFTTAQRPAAQGKIPGATFGGGLV